MKFKRRISKGGSKNSFSSLNSIFSFYFSFLSFKNKQVERENERKRLISIAKQEKEKVRNFVLELNSRYKEGKLSYLEYENSLEITLKRKSPEYWFDYYDNYIKRLSIMPGGEREKIKFNFSHFFIILVILFLGLSCFLFISDFDNITGFVVDTLGMPTETMNNETIINETIVNETNITIPVAEPPINITPEIPITNETNISIPEPMPIINETNVSIPKPLINITPEIPINITPEIPEEPVNISELIQESSEIGKPVRWKLKVKTIDSDEAKKFLPSIATIISEQQIVENYEINYETPAPTIEEKTKGNRKIITVSGPDEVHYHNISASTTLPKEARQNQIKLYRTTDNFKEQVQITNFIDENNNGLIDKIEWIVPHLSNQTYELIIEIIKAEHLDNNRIFISDIFNETKELDGIWSETLSNQHYVRVTFEENLTSEKDITIYPKVISGNPRIEVYEVNENVLIAEFTNLVSNEYNSVMLTNLQNSQDVFDLRIIGGSVEIEHILDPDMSTLYNFAICTAGTNCWAYEAEVDQFPFGDNADNRNSYATATSTEFTAISSYDDGGAEWMTADGGSGDEMSTWWTFFIDLEESPINSIINITLSHFGNSDGSAATNYAVYVLDYDAAWHLDASWTQLGGTTSVPQDVDTWVNRTLTENFATYIDPATGNITFLVFSNRASEDMRVEYVEMVVNYAPPEETPPQWSQNSTSSREAGTSITHTVKWEDSGLSGYIFSFDNGTGTFVNDSFVAFTGTTNWSNVTKAVNSTVGATIRWKVYANDTNNNWNETGNFSYETLTGFVAEGGVIVNDGDYRLHVFNTTGSDTFSVLSGSGDIEVLVVAGGAGGGTGGTAARGGGGAGGIVNDLSYSVSVGHYAVEVGAGSAGASGTSTQSDNGGDSSFNDLLALGGGGAGIHSTAGKDGGSGGGGSGYLGELGGAGLQPGSASGGYGNNGGASYNGGAAPGRQGGGGGAGAAGQDGQELKGGDGGVGLEFSQFAIAGGSPAGWFGGGGGGGAGTDDTSAGSGGQGGGGAGGMGVVGGDGTANTGGGGGGSTSTGGAGGSGIVIIRYILSDTTPPWSVEYQAPTLANLSNTSNNWIFVNASVQDTSGISTCILDWQGSNETSYMTKAGTNVSCYVNKTGLSDGTYYFKVHANDTTNKWNMSLYRTIYVDSTGPTITAARINESTPQLIGRRVKVNASITDAAGHLSNVTLTVIPPSGIGYNTSVEIGDAGSNEWKNESIALDVAGKWQFKWWANDTHENNATEVFAQDGLNLYYINASNGPQFKDYSKNVSLIGAGKFIKFNVTVTDGDGISYVNGTVDGNDVDFSLVSGSEYMYQWGPCTETDATIDFTYVSGNDTMGVWNSTTVTGVSAACDADSPTVQDEGYNATTIEVNQWFCINATVTDTNDVSTVYANIWNSSGIFNVTMIDDGSTACDVDASDNIYGIDIQGTKEGYWNYTRVYANDSLGNLEIYSITHNITINVTPVSNTAPVVEHVSNILATSPVESNARDIKFSFTAYDEQGVADIDSSSIKVNLSVSQTHNVSHYNSSCVNAGNLDDYRINFSCAVDLWYWEPDTKWNVTINISDDSGLESTNKTTYFDYTTLTSIKIGPSSISFAGVSPGSSNITGSSSILVNNTGNDNTKIIAVNASNLWNSSVLGTQTSKYIAAENFTIDIETGASKPECDIGGNAFSLVNSTYVNLEGIYLLRGNNTASEGQRRLYYCLVNVSSSFPSGDYDTTTQGPWWIKILAVLIVPASLLRKRRERIMKTIEICLEDAKTYKIKEDRIIRLLRICVEDCKEKMKSEDILKLIERRIINEINIPLSVFKDKKHVLESLVKYLKENMKLSLHEIALLLRRDDRTIWTTYNNAKKLKTEIKKTRNTIPISIFTEKRLSILESVIMHLKEQGMKNIEIAKLLERDQRNIASLINRAENKLR